MNNTERTIEELKEFANGNKYDTEYTDLTIFDMAIKALEKQVFFENEVEMIRDWFVDNKDCLLDSAQKVARDGFIESCVDEFIDEVDLDFIVVDIVDEIQKGILNVLDTFKDN